MSYNNNNNNNNNNVKWLKKLIVTSTVCLNVLTSSSSSSLADSWNDKNRLAAETWKTVDDLYYDRSFNHKDWFQLRQDLVKKSYSNDDEVYDAIKNMLSKLDDKYTRYLPPAQYTALVNSAMGELTGVGVELLGRDDGTVTINNIEEDSPAKDSSLQKGDVIVNIDGTEAKGLSPEEVAANIRGKAGTKASLRILRDGKEIDFTILRRPFKLKSVIWSLTSINGKPCGIITIKSFSDKTSEDVTKAMEAFHKSSNLQAIIIDMRNNGGGLLQGAIETAALFMNPGKIVVFEISKEGLVDAKQTLPSSIKSDDDKLPDTSTPLYVLVNSNTASAAEVLSAALKENGRGKLVGEKTFGKGTARVIIIIIIIIIIITIIIMQVLFKRCNN